MYLPKSPKLKQVSYVYYKFNILFLTFMSWKNWNDLRLFTMWFIFRVIMIFVTTELSQYMRLSVVFTLQFTCFWCITTRSYESDVHREIVPADADWDQEFSLFLKPQGKPPWLMQDGVPEIQLFSTIPILGNCYFLLKTSIIWNTSL